MYKRFKILFLLLIFVFPLVPVQAHEAADIFIDGIWAIPCEDHIAVFFTVNNTEVAHPIGLIAASSPVAEHAHLVEGEDGCSAEMVDRIIIPFGETLNLAEANYAISLEMTDAYEVGDPFSLTLTFDMLDEDLNSDGMPVDVVVGVPILEEAPAESAILITTAWVRPTVMESMSEHHHGDETTHDHAEETESMPMFPASVYMRLLNRGTEDDRLIRAETPFAEIVELHQTTVENDVMRMGEIDGLDLPVGEWVAFETGSYHIMLVNLTQELYEGDAIPLTLTFESGTELTVIVPVYDPMMGHAEEEHHDH